MVPPHRCGPRRAVVRQARAPHANERRVGGARIGLRKVKAAGQARVARTLSKQLEQ
jgi:hypothetical protein